MTFWKRIYICLAAVVAVGCSGGEGVEPEGPVSLTLDFSAYSGGVLSGNTKAGEDYSLEGLDDPEHPENMAVGALAVDGRIMAELVVMVVKDGKIVAFRDIHHGSDDIDGDNGFLAGDGSIDTTLTYSSSARVTFSHSDAKHGEDLRRGAYKLYAAALPYGDLARKYYGDLFSDFRDIRDRLVNGELVDFSEIYDTKIDISSPVEGETSECPYLYPKVGQWLSAGTDITLRYGGNKARLELLRTAARVRIDITNNSSEVLNINTLAFSDAFTRKDSWLFQRSEYSLNYYDTGLGAPAVGSNRAIISFNGSVENPLKVEPGVRQGVFDGYINENRSLDNPFAYSLSVYYDGMDPEFRASADPVSSLDSLKAGSTFYIGKYDRKEYLYHWFSETDERYEIVRADQGSNEAIFYNPDRNYIWQIEHLDGDADGVYVLRSLSLLHDTDVYVAPYGESDADKVSDKNYTDPDSGETFNYGSKCILSGDSNRMTRFKFVDAGNSSFALKVVDRRGNDIELENYSGQKIYLNVNGGIQKKDIGFWPESSLADNDKFQFYPVHSVVGNSTVMTLKEKGAKITEIKRNDFLRIHLKVSYNQNVGQFSFEVAPWDKNDNETTFD